MSATTTQSPPETGEAGAHDAPDIKAMNRHELAAEIKAVEAAMSELTTKGGEDLKALSDEEVSDLEALADYRAELQTELGSRPNPAAIKAKIGVLPTHQAHSAPNRPHLTTTARPHMGGQNAPGSGAAAANAHAGDTKGSIELLESEDDKYVMMGPWKGLGHFAMAIRNHGGNQPGRVIDDSELGQWNSRIAHRDNAVKAQSPDVKAATGNSEFADSDGAAFVPIQIAADIWERTTEDETNLLSMVDTIPVSGNNFTQPAWNDKTKASGVLYGGASAYWTAEATEMTATKPTARKIEWKLNKLYVLFAATEELLEDTVALDSRLATVAAKCFTHKINSAIVRGTGVGMPKGILNESCKITVAAVSGQGTNTIVGANISAMWKRRAPGVPNNLVWLYNVDIEDQLDQLNFTTGSNTNTAYGQFMYLPVGGLRELQQPRLKGRPMYETEHCSALGTEGDLILWDPQSYGAIVKTSGIRSAVSMHLRFAYDESLFRWTFRMDGRSYWDDVFTPAAGATRSPIVTLNSTRS